MLPASRLFASHTLNMRRLSRTAVWGLLTLSSALLLAACGGSGTSGSAAPVSVGLHGAVHGGRQAITGATILVYEADPTPNAPAQEIANTTSDSSGSWNVATFTTAPTNGQLIYVVAQGGDATPGVANPNAELMTVAGTWGSSNFPATVNINELTTVASTSVLQNYITEVDCSLIIGTTISTSGSNCPSITGATGLSARAGTLGNLVDVTTGQASTLLTSAASGSALNTTLKKLNFQASLLAACVNSAGGNAGDNSACGNLFLRATSPTSGPTAGVVSNQQQYTLDVTTLYTPDGITVSPDGAYVYMGDDNGYLATFNVSSDNALTQASVVQDSNAYHISGVAASPDGQYVFATDSFLFSGEIDTFAVGTGGALTQTANTVSDNNQPTGITVSPDGKYVFVADNAGAAGVPQIVTYSVGAGGALTSVSTLADSNYPAALAVSADGTKLYVADTVVQNGIGNDIAIYAIASDGSLTYTSSISSGNDTTSISVSSDGAHLLTADGTSNTISTYGFNSYGNLTTVTPVSNSGDPAGVVFSHDGSHAFVTQQNGYVGTYAVGPATNTLHAALNIAKSSDSRLGSELFAQAPLPVVYSPIPSTAPANWTVGGSEFAYTANKNGLSVSAFTIGRTGALTAVSGSPFAAGSTPVSVTVSPNGAFAYVANYDDDTVSAYTIDPATGTLAAVGGSPFATGSSPDSLAVSPNGAFAYITNFGDATVSAYTIDPATGALSAVGSAVAAGGGTLSVTVSPDGAFAYTANAGDNTVSAWSINSSTGALTPVAGSPFVTGSAPYSVTVTPNGAFTYVAGHDGTVSAYAINSSTGALSTVSGSPFFAGTGPDAVTVSPDGAFAYVANYDDGTVSAYTINPGTGALSAVSGSPFATGSGPTDITVSPDGAFAYVASYYDDTVWVYAINSSTGALTVVSGSPFVAGATPASVVVSP